MQGQQLLPKGEIFKEELFSGAKEEMTQPRRCRSHTNFRKS